MECGAFVVEDFIWTQASSLCILAEAIGSIWFDEICEKQSRSLSVFQVDKLGISDLDVLG